MTHTTSNVPGAVELQDLFDALLQSISHDLRSPLLTMSLSVELIADQTATDGGDPPSGHRVALEALQHGAKDLDRMLQGVALLSRARRRQLDDGGVRLRVLLGGHLVLSDEGDLEHHAVCVDPLVVREVIDAVAGETPTDVRAHIQDGFVHLSLPGTERIAQVDGSPLRAMVGSLQGYAGTEVETLATAELALDRQGARLRVEGGSVVLSLPLMETPA